MGVTRLLARTAPPSPVGRLTPVCLKTSCVTGGSTAETDGTRLRSCAVHLRRVNRLSSIVETDSAFLRPGGVITQRTVPMAATNTTVVSERQSVNKGDIFKPHSKCDLQMLTKSLNN